ncbi:unnamed protein product [Vitrella brassicaformis CCMP3155]|uniref:HECT domain-containing protein n=4 Tax=Vitrella brassicaformis TaxID=1169539 RepID=A0A0G4ETX2_VITBC|nr:unnamed protein product [Vitrella brassicaformis CCMP3155]|eukprot:CEM01772.1 unnamed protein product [Vitrella brassicaformis CCMP3155]
MEPNKPLTLLYDKYVSRLIHSSPASDAAALDSCLDQESALVTQEDQHLTALLPAEPRVDKSKPGKPHSFISTNPPAAGDASGGQPALPVWYGALPTILRTQEAVGERLFREASKTLSSRMLRRPDGGARKRQRMWGSSITRATAAKPSAAGATDEQRVVTDLLQSVQRVLVPAPAGGPSSPAASAVLSSWLRDRLSSPLSRQAAYSVFAGALDAFSRYAPLEVPNSDAAVGVVERVLESCLASVCQKGTAGDGEGEGECEVERRRLFAYGVQAAICFALRVASVRMLLHVASLCLGEGESQESENAEGIPAQDTEYDAMKEVELLAMFVDHRWQPAFSRDGRTARLTPPASQKAGDPSHPSSSIDLDTFLSTDVPVGQRKCFYELPDAQWLHAPGLSEDVQAIMLSAAGDAPSDGPRVMESIGELRAEKRTILAARERDIANMNITPPEPAPTADKKEATEPSAAISGPSLVTTDRAFASGVHVFQVIMQQTASKQDFLLQPDLANFEIGLIHEVSQQQQEDEKETTTTKDAPATLFNSLNRFAVDRRGRKWEGWAKAGRSSGSDDLSVFVHPQEEAAAAAQAQQAASREQQVGDLGHLPGGELPCTIEGAAGHGGGSSFCHQWVFTLLLNVAAKTCVVFLDGEEVVSFSLPRCVHSRYRFAVVIEKETQSATLPAVPALADSEIAALLQLLGDEAAGMLMPSWSAPERSRYFSGRAAALTILSCLHRITSRSIPSAVDTWPLRSSSAVLPQLSQLLLTVAERAQDGSGESKEADVALLCVLRLWTACVRAATKKASYEWQADTAVRSAVDKCAAVLSAQQQQQQQGTVQEGYDLVLTEAHRDAMMAWMLSCPDTSNGQLMELISQVRLLRSAVSQKETPSYATRGVVSRGLQILERLADVSFLVGFLFFTGRDDVRVLCEELVHLCSTTPGRRIHTLACRIVRRVIAVAGRNLAKGVAASGESLADYLSTIGRCLGAAEATAVPLDDVCLTFMTEAYLLLKSRQASPVVDRLLLSTLPTTVRLAMRACQDKNNSGDEVCYVEKFQQGFRKQRVVVTVETPHPIRASAPWNERILTAPSGLPGVGVTIEFDRRSNTDDTSAEIELSFRFHRRYKGRMMCTKRYYGRSFPHRLLFPHVVSIDASYGCDFSSAEDWGIKMTVTYVKDATTVLVSPRCQLPLSYMEIALSSVESTIRPATLPSSTRDMIVRTLLAMGRRTEYRLGMSAVLDQNQHELKSACALASQVMREVHELAPHRGGDQSVPSPSPPRHSPLYMSTPDPVSHELWPILESAAPLTPRPDDTSPADQHQHRQHHHQQQQQTPPYPEHPFLMDLIDNTPSSPAAKLLAHLLSQPDSQAVLPGTFDHCEEAERCVAGIMLVQDVACLKQAMSLDDATKVPPAVVSVWQRARKDVREWCWKQAQSTRRDKGAVAAELVAKCRFLIGVVVPCQPAAEPPRPSLPIARKKAPGGGGHPHDMTPPHKRDRGRSKSVEEGPKRANSSGAIPAGDVGRSPSVRQPDGTPRARHEKMAMMLRTREKEELQQAMEDRLERIRISTDSLSALSTTTRRTLGSLSDFAFSTFSLDDLHATLQEMHLHWLKAGVAWRAAAALISVVTDAGGSVDRGEIKNLLLDSMERLAGSTAELLCLDDKATAGDTGGGGAAVRFERGARCLPGALSRLKGLLGDPGSSSMTYQLLAKKLRSDVYMSICRAVSLCVHMVFSSTAVQRSITPANERGRGELAAIQRGSMVIRVLQELLRALKGDSATLTSCRNETISCIVDRLERETRATTAIRQHQDSPPRGVQLHFGLTMLAVTYEVDTPSAAAKKDDKQQQHQSPKGVIEKQMHLLDSRGGVKLWGMYRHSRSHGGAPRATGHTAELIGSVDAASSVGGSGWLVLRTKPPTISPLSSRMVCVVDAKLADGPENNPHERRGYAAVWTKALTAKELHASAPADVTVFMVAKKAECGSDDTCLQPIQTHIETKQQRQLTTANLWLAFAALRARDGAVDTSLVQSLLRMLVRAAGRDDADAEAVGIEVPSPPHTGRLQLAAEVDPSRVVQSAVQPISPFLSLLCTMLQVDAPLAVSPKVLDIILGALQLNSPGLACKLTKSIVTLAAQFAQRSADEVLKAFDERFPLCPPCPTRIFSRDAAFGATTSPVLLVSDVALPLEASSWLLTVSVPVSFALVAMTLTEIEEARQTGFEGVQGAMHFNHQLRAPSIAKMREQGFKFADPPPSSSIEGFGTKLPVLNICVEREAASLIIHAGGRIMAKVDPERFTDLHLAVVTWPDFQNAFRLSRLSGEHATAANGKAKLSSNDFVSVGLQPVTEVGGAGHPSPSHVRMGVTLTRAAMLLAEEEPCVFLGRCRSAWMINTLQARRDKAQMLGILACLGPAADECADALHGPPASSERRDVTVGAAASSKEDGTQWFDPLRCDSQTAWNQVCGLRSIDSRDRQLFNSIMALQRETGTGATTNLQASTTATPFTPADLLDTSFPEALSSRYSTHSMQELLATVISVVEWSWEAVHSTWGQQSSLLDVSGALSRTTEDAKAAAITRSKNWTGKPIDGHHDMLSQQLLCSALATLNRYASFHDALQQMVSPADGGRYTFLLPLLESIAAGGRECHLPCDGDIDKAVSSAKRRLACELMHLVSYAYAKLGRDKGEPSDSFLDVVSDKGEQREQAANSQTEAGRAGGVGGEGEGRGADIPANEVAGGQGDGAEVANDDNGRPPPLVDETAPGGNTRCVKREWLVDLLSRWGIHQDIRDEIPTTAEMLTWEEVHQTLLGVESKPSSSSTGGSWPTHLPASVLVDRILTDKDALTTSDAHKDLRSCAGTSEPAIIRPSPRSADLAASQDDDPFNAGNISNSENDEGDSDTSDRSESGSEYDDDSDRSQSENGHSSDQDQDEGASGDQPQTDEAAVATATAAAEAAVAQQPSAAAGGGDADEGLAIDGELVRSLRQRDEQMLAWSQQEGAKSRLPIVTQCFKPMCRDGHILQRTHIRRGWRCDSPQFDGCCLRGGKFDSSSKVGRYRCEACDFDLCDKCYARRKAILKKEAVSRLDTVVAVPLVTDDERAKLKREIRAQQEPLTEELLHVYRTEASLLAQNLLLTLYLSDPTRALATPSRTLFFLYDCVRSRPSIAHRAAQLVTAMATQSHSFITELRALSKLHLVGMELTVRQIDALEERYPRADNNAKVRADFLRPVGDESDAGFRSSINHTPLSVEQRQRQQQLGAEGKDLSQQQPLVSGVGSITIFGRPSADGSAHPHHVAIFPAQLLMARPPPIRTVGDVIRAFRRPDMSHPAPAKTAGSSEQPDHQQPQPQPQPASSPSAELPPAAAEHHVWGMGLSVTVTGSTTREGDRCRVYRGGGMGCWHNMRGPTDADRPLVIVGNDLNVELALSKTGEAVSAWEMSIDFATKEQLLQAYNQTPFYDKRADKDGFFCYEPTLNLAFIEWLVDSLIAASSVPATIRCQLLTPTLLTSLLGLLARAKAHGGHPSPLRILRLIRTVFEAYLSLENDHETITEPAWCFIFAQLCSFASCFRIAGGSEEDSSAGSQTTGPLRHCPPLLEAVMSVMAALSDKVPGEQLSLLLTVARGVKGEDVTASGSNNLAVLMMQSLAVLKSIRKVCVGSGDCRPVPEGAAFSRRHELDAATHCQAICGEFDCHVRSRLRMYGKIHSPHPYASIDSYSYRDAPMPINCSGDRDTNTNNDDKSTPTSMPECIVCLRELPGTSVVDVDLSRDTHILPNQLLTVWARGRVKDQAVDSSNGSSKKTHTQLTDDRWVLLMCAASGFGKTGTAMWEVTGDPRQPPPAEEAPAAEELETATEQEPPPQESRSPGEQQQQQQEDGAEGEVSASNKQASEGSPAPVGLPSLPYVGGSPTLMTDNQSGQHSDGIEDTDDWTRRTAPAPLSQMFGRERLGESQDNSPLKMVDWPEHVIDQLIHSTAGQQNAPQPPSQPSSSAAAATAQQQQQQHSAADGFVSAEVLEAMDEETRKLIEDMISQGAAAPTYPDTGTEDADDSWGPPPPFPPPVPVDYDDNDDTAAQWVKENEADTLMLVLKATAGDALRKYFQWITANAGGFPRSRYVVCRLVSSHFVVDRRLAPCTRAVRKAQELHGGSDPYACLLIHGGESMQARLADLQLVLTAAARASREPLWSTVYLAMPQGAVSGVLRHAQLPEGVFLAALEEGEQAHCRLYGIRSSDPAKVMEGIIFLSNLRQQSRHEISTVIDEPTPLCGPDGDDQHPDHEAHRTTQVPFYPIAVSNVFFTADINKITFTVRLKDAFIDSSRQHSAHKALRPLTADPTGAAGGGETNPRRVTVGWGRLFDQELQPRSAGPPTPGRGDVASMTGHASTMVSLGVMTADDVGTPLTDRRMRAGFYVSVSWSAAGWSLDYCPFTQQENDHPSPLGTVEGQTPSEVNLAGEASPSGGVAEGGVFSAAAGERADERQVSAATADDDGYEVIAVVSPPLAPPHTLLTWPATDPICDKSPPLYPYSAMKEVCSLIGPQPAIGTASHPLLTTDAKSDRIGDAPPLHIPETTNDRPVAVRAGSGDSNENGGMGLDTLFAELPPAPPAQRQRHETRAARQIDKAHEVTFMLQVDLPASELRLLTCDGLVATLKLANTTATASNTATDGRRGVPWTVPLIPAAALGDVGASVRIDQVDAAKGWIPHRKVGVADLSGHGIDIMTRLETLSTPPAPITHAEVLLPPPPAAPAGHDEQANVPPRSITSPGPPSHTTPQSSQQVVPARRSTSDPHSHTPPRVADKSTLPCPVPQAGDVRVLPPPVPSRVIQRQRSEQVQWEPRQLWGFGVDLAAIRMTPYRVSEAVESISAIKEWKETLPDKRSTADQLAAYRLQQLPWSDSLLVQALEDCQAENLDSSKADKKKNNGKKPPSAKRMANRHRAASFTQLSESAGQAIIRRLLTLADETAQQAHQAHRAADRVTAAASVDSHMRRYKAQMESEQRQLTAISTKDTADGEWDAEETPSEKLAIEQAALMLISLHHGGEEPDIPLLDRPPQPQPRVPSVSGSEDDSSDEDEDDEDGDGELVEIVSDSADEARVLRARERGSEPPSSESDSDGDHSDDGSEGSEEEEDDDDETEEYHSARSGTMESSAGGGAGDRCVLWQDTEAYSRSLDTLKRRAHNVAVKLIKAMGHNKRRRASSTKGKAATKDDDGEEPGPTPAAAAAAATDTPVSSPDRSADAVRLYGEIQPLGALEMVVLAAIEQLMLVGRWRGTGEEGIRWATRDTDVCARLAAIVALMRQVGGGYGPGSKRRRLVEAGSVTDFLDTRIRIIAHINRSVAFAAPLLTARCQSQSIDHGPTPHTSPAPLLQASCAVALGHTDTAVVRELLEVCERGGGPYHEGCSRVGRTEWGCNGVSGGGGDRNEVYDGGGGGGWVDLLEMVAGAKHFLFWRTKTALLSAESLWQPYAHMSAADPLLCGVYASDVLAHAMRLDGTITDTRKNKTWLHQCPDTGDKVLTVCRTAGHVGATTDADSRDLPTDDTLRQSLWAQVSGGLAESVHPLDHLGRTHAFKVQLRGEMASDLGGPYSEVISHVCDDVCGGSSSQFPLFIDSANARDAVGSSREIRVLNPQVGKRLNETFPHLRQFHTQFGSKQEDDTVNGCSSDFVLAHLASVVCEGVRASAGGGRRRGDTLAIGCYRNVLGVMLFGLGKLMGIAMLTRSPLNLTLCSALWKTLCGEKATLHDVAQSDYLTAQLIERVKIAASSPPPLSGDTDMSEAPNLSRLSGASEGSAIETGSSNHDNNQEGSTSTTNLLPNPPPWEGLSFTVVDNGGQLVELFPGGAMQAVTSETAAEWAEAAEAFKTSEDMGLFRLVAAGLESMVPAPLLQALLSAHDLEKLVCGEPQIDIDELQRNTKIRPTHRGHRETQLLKWFWSILRSFSTLERQAFLRFVSGRSRLPASWSESTGAERKTQLGALDQFELCIISDEEAMEVDSGPTSQQAEGSIDDRLPTSDTCFFTLKLPKYSSSGILRDRLVFAITHCTAIDRDFDVNNDWGDNEE